MISAIALSIGVLVQPVQQAPSQSGFEPPAEETLFAYLPLSVWAQTLSRGGGVTVRQDDIRQVACVGLESTYMLCAWEQRVDGEWLRLSQYADVSQVDTAPVRLIGEASKSSAPGSDSNDPMIPGLGEGEWIVPDYPLKEDSRTKPPR